MSDVKVTLHPLTAREALLLIRLNIAQLPVRHGLTRAERLAEDIDQIAELGLSRTDPINFELSDHLADRLGEAHQILRDLRAPLSADGNMTDRLNAALALPPDLEAMVERRIG